jgi:hypothetical protein
VRPKTLAPTWGDDAVDDAVVAARDARDLDTAHLFLLLQHADFLGAPVHALGAAVLRLGPAAAAGGAPVQFDLPVVKNGREHGRIVGALAVTFLAPGEKRHELRTHRRESTPCFGCMR